jgi:hypothetical protein
MTFFPADAFDTCGSAVVGWYSTQWVRILSYFAVILQDITWRNYFIEKLLKNLENLKIKGVSFNANSGKICPIVQ